MCRPGMKDNTEGKDQDRNGHPPNSYASASLVSKVLFLWPYNLLKVGKNKIIDEDDLEEILDTERSDVNLSWIEQKWKEAIENHSNRHKKGNPTLHRVILIDFIKSLWYDLNPNFNIHFFFEIKCDALCHLFLFQ